MKDYQILSHPGDLFCLDCKMIFYGFHRFLFIIIFYLDLLDADQLALTGSPVQLLCPYKATSDHVLWNYFVAGKALLLTDNNNINKITLSPEVYNRLSVSGDQTVGEYHLDISDIRKSDEGRYECSVSTNTERIHLTVIVGPTAVTIDNVTQNNTIPGIEGHAMTIKCTATGGQPPPDVNLVILGSTYTGKHSAQHTFKPNSSMDGSTITCQTGYTDINHFPFNTTAYINLKLKPVITPFDTDTWDTEETKSFDVSCQSTGSRPAASMYWFLEQQNITSNSTSQSNHDQATDKNTVMSYLRYRVDRSYNGQKLICGAVNIAGNMELTIRLNVKYAPGVTVENKTFSLTQSTRQVESTLHSNPPVNTCNWHHRSKYGEHIRNFSDNNQILKLPSVSEDKRYQDTGEYVCTAENGIEGLNGQLKQTGSGYMISNAPPVITADNKDNTKQYGKFGKSTELKVNVYSIPKFTSKNWYIGNTHLVSNKYETDEEPAIVKDVFHGVEVQLDGYRVTLTISDLQKTDFTHYTLRLYNSSSQYVQHEVTLESASAPETPSNFTITGSGETSITIQWIPGYDGGQTQIFYIEYRITGSSKWMSHEIKTSHQIDTQNLYNLPGLQDKTSYELRMYAKNKFNQSQHTDIKTRRTSEKANSTALGGVIGGVAGGLTLVIVILILIAFVLFKRKTGSGFPSKRTRSHSDSEVEEGLKDNVLYEGSETEVLKVNILYKSAGPDSINQGPNAEYAEVSKPAKKPSKSSNDEYAEVKKQNAEVDKKAQQKNVKNKKQKEKKKPPKPGITKGGALNNNPDGEYANSGIPMGNMSDGAYSNTKNHSAGNKKNDQGLEYADLTFGSPISKAKQSVIHGNENRTIYSEVDHTKKAPPPPQESEYEETDIRHGKK